MVVLELYYKGTEELTALAETAVIELHQRVGLTRVLLTYKGRPSATDNPQDAALLRQLLPPQIAVSAVWSAKNAYIGSGKHARGGHATKEDATFARFKEYDGAMQAAGAASLLVRLSTLFSCDC